MSFVIEKGIPLPPVINAALGGLAATIRSMEIGDSFFYKTDKKNPIQHLRGCIPRDCEPKNYKSASVEGGVRIWRIS